MIGWTRQGGNYSKWESNATQNKVTVKGCVSVMESTSIKSPDNWLYSNHRLPFKFIVRSLVLQQKKNKLASLLQERLVGILNTTNRTKCPHALINNDVLFFIIFIQIPFYILYCALWLVSGLSLTVSSYWWVSLPYLFSPNSLVTTNHEHLGNNMGGYVYKTNARYLGSRHQCNHHHTFILYFSIYPSLYLIELVSNCCVCF